MTKTLYKNTKREEEDYECEPLTPTLPTNYEDLLPLATITAVGLYVLGVVIGVIL